VTPDLSPTPWIDRVREADAEAEEAWRKTAYESTTKENGAVFVALIAIAAELRAQRIARRPGAGQ
jgi:hypothetical protein